MEDIESELSDSRDFLVPKKRKRTTQSYPDTIIDPDLNGNSKLEYDLKKEGINIDYAFRLEKLNTWREKKLNKLKRKVFYLHKDKKTEIEDERDEIINKSMEFHFYHRTQFLLNDGRSSCAGISLTLIWNFLRDRTLAILQLNYELIIDSGIGIWLKWKKESKSIENFANIHTILELKLFEKPRTKLKIIKEMGGSLIDKLNLKFDDNYSDITKRVAWSIPDAFYFINLNYFNKRIAGSLTIKDYTITLLKELNSSDIYLFDSHGIGDQLIKFNYKIVSDSQREKSVLIKFSQIGNLIHYIKIRYPSEKPLQTSNNHIKFEDEDNEFFNVIEPQEKYNENEERRMNAINYYENTYSLILFELNEKVLI